LACTNYISISVAFFDPDQANDNSLAIRATASKAILSKPARFVKDWVESESTSTGNQQVGNP
jgi:hypothetical protein